MDNKVGNPSMNDEVDKGDQKNMKGGAKDVHIVNTARNFKMDNGIETSSGFQNNEVQDEKA